MVYEDLNKCRLHWQKHDETARKFETRRGYFFYSSLKYAKMVATKRVYSLRKGKGFKQGNTEYSQLSASL